ncbi:MATE family efflux transporter [Cohnella sp. 56]|uniref:MATE family efflux transporter n=1 Tax=Cohnella sp. 56 TaxID=3113722 RepID=UPI0030EAF02F
MQKTNGNSFGLWMLAWPIFLEIFLQTLLGTVDTLMVSRISDDAVAVVGISSQLFGALITLFTSFAGGAGILIAQRMGSGRLEDAGRFALMGVTFSGALSILLSLALFLFAGPIGGMLGIADSLRPMASVYISYVGGGMFLVGLSISFGTAIRNTGYTRGPMYTGVAINVLHIALNYLFIFGALGFPKLGLEGIAWSNLISRLIGAALLYVMFRQCFGDRVRLREFFALKLAYVKEIIKIAWPIGIQASSWTFSQLLVYSFISWIGTEALAARTYLNTLESYCFTLGYAVAMAGQIRTAHLFGGGRIVEAYRGAYRTLYIGWIIVISNMLLMWGLGRPLIGLFTHNPDIQALCLSMLAINLLLQPAKMLNMAMSNALNAIGDTRFTMCTALVSMSVIGVGCAYAFGVEAGLGLAGIYWCMLADETVRGMLVLSRWRSGKILRARERRAGTAAIAEQA